ncbi:hypothetical protein PGB90_002307 [Kerria lacca]
MQFYVMEEHKLKSFSSTGCLEIINDYGIVQTQLYTIFHKTSYSRMVLFPLILSKMLNKVDVEVTNVKKPVSGGDSSLANAIRWAVSKGVFQFVDVETKERLKLAGLIQRELRYKERKKPGQEGARRKNMASVSDDNCSLKSDSLHSEQSTKDCLKEKELAIANDNMPENCKPINEPTGLFDLNHPLKICSPLGLPNSYKPVFGSNRSILKPSTLFTDANVSSPSVTFGNYSSKVVKLKPSVLTNPFVNSNSEKNSNESKLNCDDKTEMLPSSQKEDIMNDNTVSSTQTVSTSVFVPLDDPVSNSSSTCKSPISSTTNNTASVHVVNSNISTESSSSSVSSEFIFGQNLHERVSIEAENAQKSATQNGTTFSEMLFSSTIKQDKKKENISHEFSNGNTKTLSASAKEYEEAHSVKRKYEEVTVVTGEEDEQNILQINCKLFIFDNILSSWTERGRGTLRVNDKETPDGRSSRLVVRLAGNLRVVLNTKIWTDMNVQLVSKRSVRLTAIDNDGQVRIYLVTAQPKDADQLFNVLTTRIQKKKLKTNSEDSASSSAKND